MRRRRFIPLFKYPLLVAEALCSCHAYSFQTFAVGEALASSKMNQIEVNIRDHVHGTSGVSILTPKVGSFTRDTSLASGSQAVTGVGFKPSLIIFLSGSATGSGGGTSIGFDALSSCNALYHTNAADTWAIQAGSSIVANEGAGISYGGMITSLDADGFTIAWVKTGATAGTLTIDYVAFR